MCKHWTQEGGGQVGASEDMKKTRSYGGLRVFGGGGMWIHQFKSAS